MMVNFKFGDKCDKNEIINMTRAQDKEKMWVPGRNRTHDLPNTFIIFPDDFNIAVSILAVCRMHLIHELS